MAPVTRVPTIDISALFNDDLKSWEETADKIGKAVKDIGFLSITGTGVSADCAADLRNAVQACFAIPEASKHEQAVTRDNYRGYIPFGFFTPNDGSGKADNYEGFKLHVEIDKDAPVRRDCSLYGPNLWPRETPELKSATLAYWAEMDRLTHALLRAFCHVLELPLDRFEAAFYQPLTNMTLLHYPPQAANDTGFGIHAHKDTDALTIISPDPVGGLEVRMPDQTWHQVECPEGGFIVNIGDMLELWSGGRFVSTPHRVVNKSGKERYSFPYFAVPRHDITVAPVVSPIDGFSRPSVHCGHWSAETWRTNWPDEKADGDTPELGTIH
ncbi:isopenicillin N synthase family dioxygenase [Cochlodiniinecator piscidefendens]|uniref:isopenicillin N synthase family dioxygenase n=1 Tax=Cochlodiniinecator piscidefendens TaxID=2715756 RepID=UPI001E5F99D3|nr:2OG-Fe(II) oxygenase family protein [Cochlodiniinecator piscidefendens]